MTTPRLLALAAVLAAAGCSSAPSRFYTLDATATDAGGPALLRSILVGPVSVPASVDRPEFVVQVAPNRVEIDEFNRWAGPLGDSIARVVATNLTALLGTPDVASGPLASFAPDYRVTIDVQRFESRANDAVWLDAVWLVKPTGGGRVRSGRTTTSEPLAADDYAAIAGAHSRALGTMSAEIASAIRTADASGPHSGRTTP
jgi:uncharacterized lipoprotein YmbA